jgi:hypothetical protein
MLGGPLLLTALRAALLVAGFARPLLLAGALAVVPPVITALPPEVCTYVGAVIVTAAPESGEHIPSIPAGVHCGSAAGSTNSPAPLEPLQ